LVGVIICFFHVGNAENKSEQHAKSTNGDIADGKEVVLTSESVSGTDNKCLLSLEFSDLIIVTDLKVVITRRQVNIDSTIELTEVGKACSSHPHDEVSYKKTLVK